MSGIFIVSLDFELLWGVRDHADRNKYGENVLGARKAIPRILDLFFSNNIRATWATVGFLFCENKEELKSYIPNTLPKYTNPRLSSYYYIDEVGNDEYSDPYYFAPTLVNAIRQTPGQEIGTHTLSHYYCLEDGQTLASFEADLAAAQKLASARDIKLQSIVFPRNQFAAEHLEICAKRGISHFRGNPTGWAYKVTKGVEQTPSRRALRLLDAYTGFLGAQSFQTEQGAPMDVPASRFLRPCAGCLAAFHPIHIVTIKRGMTAAARAGRAYHLWWHPHNFGLNLELNMASLSEVIRHFEKLKYKFGMKSAAMADI